jgi:transcription elongation factor Elf1
MIWYINDIATLDKMLKGNAECGNCADSNAKPLTGRQARTLGTLTCGSCGRVHHVVKPARTAAEAKAKHEAQNAWLKQCMTEQRWIKPEEASA